MNEQRKGPAAARALAAMHRTTRRKINTISFPVPKSFTAVFMSVSGMHPTDLGKPKEVVDDGGGAALDLHQWDLIFSRHQDVFLVVEHSSQVHAPNEISMRQMK